MENLFRLPPTSRFLKVILTGVLVASAAIPVAQEFALRAQSHSFAKERLSIPLSPTAADVYYDPEAVHPNEGELDLSDATAEPITDLSTVGITL